MAMGVDRALHVVVEGPAYESKFWHSEHGWGVFVEEVKTIEKDSRLVTNEGEGNWMTGGIKDFNMLHYWTAWVTRIPQCIAAYRSSTIGCGEAFCESCRARKTWSSDPRQIGGRICSLVLWEERRLRYSWNMVVWLSISCPQRPLTMMPTKLLRCWPACWTGHRCEQKHIDRENLSALYEIFHLNYDNLHRPCPLISLPSFRERLPRRS